MDEKLQNLKLENAMRESGDGTLYVIAELNKMFSEKLVGLSEKLRDMHERDERLVKPGDFMLGLIAFSLAQCETFHEAFRLDKRDNKDALLAEAITEILAIGPRRFLLSLIVEAGIDIEAIAKEMTQ